MKRFTVNKDGYLPAIIDGEDIADAIARLARYEDMYDALCAEKEKIVSDMEKLRLEGKNKTVTFQQLLASKLMVMNLIGRFDIW